MLSHGWGRYPRVEAHLQPAHSLAAAVQALASTPSLIARGLGRSYGDSALATQILAMRPLDRFIAFDTERGLLSCAAGVSLAEILQVAVPRGWFLPVTPGTWHVTLGGAVASDVHGKNHHLDGSFSRHLTRIELLLGNAEQVSATPTEHAELFRATCGGMGLTGVVLAATLQLIPIRSSEIVETTCKLAGLDDLLEAFESEAASRYSVAWVDCLAGGKRLGRSLLSLGEHAPDGPLRLAGRRPLTLPLDLPPALLNRASVGAFNAAHYGRVRAARAVRRVPFENFFYPLDALAGWNRLYGKPGFVQYQFVLPKAVGASGLRQVLARIAASGRGSFLAVLKVLGEGNDNPLSFPRAGYTLALDFKAEPAVFALLDELDAQVLDLGGRLYLAKDARMNEATFKRAYPRWQEFEAVRERYHAIGKFASLQSRRLGLG